jgi:hypothetical protein
MLTTLHIGQRLDPGNRPINPNEQRLVRWSSAVLRGVTQEPARTCGVHACET